MDDTNNTNSPTIDEAGTEASPETETQTEGETESQEKRPVMFAIPVGWDEKFVGVQISRHDELRYRLLVQCNTPEEFVAQAFKCISDSQMQLVDLGIGLVRYMMQQGCTIEEAARVKCTLPFETVHCSVIGPEFPAFIFERVEVPAQVSVDPDAQMIESRNAVLGALVAGDVPDHPPIADELESWIKLEAALNACGATVVMKSGGEKPISCIWHRDGVEGEVWIRDGQIVCSGLTTAHQGEYVVSTYAQVGQLVDQIVKDAETAAAIAPLVPKESDEPTN